MHVGGAVHVTQAIGDLLRNDVVALHVLTGDLDVDRRRQSEVQNLGHDVGRLKEELHAGELSRQLLAQFPDVALGRVMMFGVQAHQDLGIAGSHHAGVAVRQIDSRIRQPDIVQDGDQLVLGNLLPQIGFHLIGQPRRFFHPQAGASTHVQAHRASVNVREEVFAEEEHQAHREHAEREKAGGKQLAMLEGGFQELIVAVAKVVKPALEPALIAAEDCFGPGGAMLVPTHDVHDQGRNQGA